MGGKRTAVLLVLLTPLFAIRVDHGSRVNEDAVGHSAGSSRQPKLLFTSLLWAQQYSELTELVASLQATVAAQATQLASLQAAVSGASSAPVTTRQEIEDIWSNINSTYYHIKVHRKRIDKKCPRTKCDTILKKVKEVKGNLTALEAKVDAINGVNVTELLLKLTPIDACMTDPTASACTGTYSSASSLPALVAAACSSSTCSTITSDVAVIKDCFTDPSSSGCTSSYPSTTSSTLPGVLATKCDSSTCLTLTSDLTVIKDCFTDPSASGCTSTYSATVTSGTLPLPSVLAASCSSSTCTSLQTSVTNLDSCMKTPTDAACTGIDLGGTNSLPASVSLLTSCTTTPQDASCSLKTTTTSVPYQVNNMDACFTSIDSATCGASYGASALLPSSEGTGLVGWTKQLKQPAVTQCTMDNTALTFPNTASGTSPDVSTVAGTPTPIVPGCDVSRIYEKITFAKCSQTDQPNSATSYHLQPNKAQDEITINKEGVYKIEFTALMKSTDQKLMRAEVFKITSKDSAANCGSITAACTTLLQMRTKTQLVEAAVRTADKTDERTTNTEGFFTLCEGDRLLIIASKGGSQATNLGTISGDEDGIRTFLTVEKMGFTD